MTEFRVAYESAGSYLGETIDAPDAISALDQAEASLAWSDYDGVLRSVIEEITVTDELDTSHAHSRVVVLDPPEPECAFRGEPHIWGDEEAVGNGGGVIVSATCPACGWERKINTWADDGQGGHIRTIAYSLHGGL
jgi:hypothetical protein